MGVNLLTSRAIIGTFYARLEQGASGWVQRLAMRMSSNQASEEYAWLGMTPTMREWIGGRHAKGFRENSFRIDNKENEATLLVKRSELRRDKSGQVMVRINELAERTNAYPARLLSRLIQDGESSVCYDGQFFFDTDHAEGHSGPQSNRITVDISALPVSNHGSTTAPSVGEMRETILRGVQQILGFVDDQGEPVNENARTFEVMVPTSLWAVATAAVTMPLVDAGESNVLANMNGREFAISVVINPRLTWTDRLTIYRTDGQVKPFILQEEVPVEMSAIAEGSEREFEHNEHLYGVYWVGNVGYGYWQQACMVQMI